MDKGSVTIRNVIHSMYQWGVSNNHSEQVKGIIQGLAKLYPDDSTLVENDTPVQDEVLKAWYRIKALGRKVDPNEFAFQTELNFDGKEEPIRRNCLTCRRGRNKFLPCSYFDFNRTMCQYWKA